MTHTNHRLFSTLESIHGPNDRNIELKIESVMSTIGKCTQNQPSLVSNLIVEEDFIKPLSEQRNFFSISSFQAHKVLSECRATYPICEFILITRIRNKQ